jgi:P4 family phage/plasmid primase-like protien
MINTADALALKLTDFTQSATLLDDSTDLAAQTYGPAILDLSTDKYEKYELNQKYFSGRYFMDVLVLYDLTTKRFYLYDSGTGLWISKSDSSIANSMGELFQQIIMQKRPELLARRTSNFLHSLVEMLRGIAEREDAFNRSRAFVHVANGVLAIDPQTGEYELKPFDHNYYSRNRSEVEWIPDAECPQFIAELLKSALSDDDIELMQKYFGQCLLGINLAQLILILRGTPGGGKSTFVEVIEKIIGLHNVSELRVAHLAQRFELVRLIGRTLLTGKDVPGNFLDTSPAHILKKLTGNDLIEGEVKGGNQSFQLRGNFNVIITSNSRLRIQLDSDTGAWRRRLLIVDYERPKPEIVIPEFGDKLIQAEGPGILRWGLEGAVKLLQDVANGGIHLTETQQKRVDDLLYESDSVFSFVRDCVQTATGGNVTTAELQIGYQEYCEHRGWQALPERRFLTELPDAMLTLRRSVKRTDIKRDDKNQRGFAGVAYTGIRNTGECV